MVAMLFAIPVWIFWISGTLLLFFLGQLLLSYLLPDRSEPPAESSDYGRDIPAARWPRPVRPPKVTRRLILPRTDPYAPRPFVVYRRPLRLTRRLRFTHPLRLTRPVRSRPVRTRPVRTNPASR